MASDEAANVMNGEDELRYLIVRPERGGLRDLWRFWREGDEVSEAKFIDKSSSFGYDDDHEMEDLFNGKDKRWVIVVSVLMRKLLVLCYKPMQWTGYVVDFILNLLSHNGNLLGLLYNFLQGKVVIPKRGSATFISSIGYLDGRIDLCKTDNFVGGPSITTDVGVKSLMDLCIMASKLAYENASLVEEVVVNHWKMHFVGFYDCWNDYQKRMSTQVFIMCDKPTDASLILISFRGTEPFDAYDWSTDFDYSWYEVPGLGKVHVGFLEALGLGSRTNTASFEEKLLLNDTKLPLSESSTVNQNEITAYDAVKAKLRELLLEHKNAKFLVTGHSLGGALAIMFPTVLILHEEKAMMEKLLAVYTFGQPRFADRKLGQFIEAQLNKPVLRYFRVVYCNDVIPRVPYDDKTFLYKHFGVCLYYNSHYVEQKVEEEPNPNYFGMRFCIPEHMNAMWELVRGLTMRYVHGPEYAENWYSIMLRLLGLLMPGFAAHSPREYVNSVRLGRER